MNTSIFIPTFRRDIPYLIPCLRSIRKFGRGFHEVVVDAPIQDKELVEPICHEFGACLMTHEGETASNGGLFQQLVKLKADIWCPDANVILYVDSDCCFIEQFQPEDYIASYLGSKGFSFWRAILCMKPWSESSPDEINAWSLSTQQIMGFRCDYNTMVRHPAAHHAWVLPLFRDYIEKRFNKAFDEFVLSRSSGIRPGISEFNCLGSFVRQFYPHEYHLIDISKEGRPKDKLWQGWSRKGIRPEDEAVWKRLGLV